MEFLGCAMFAFGTLGAIGGGDVGDARGFFNFSFFISAHKRFQPRWWRIMFQSLDNASWIFFFKIQTFSG